MVNTLTIRFDTVTLNRIEFTEMMKKLHLKITMMEYHKRHTTREHTHCIVQGDYRKAPKDLKAYINKHRERQPGVDQSYAGKYGLDVQVVRDIPQMEDYILKEKTAKLLKEVAGRYFDQDKEWSKFIYSKK